MKPYDEQKIIKTFNAYMEAASEKLRHDKELMAEMIERNLPGYCGRTSDLRTLNQFIDEVSRVVRSAVFACLTAGIDVHFDHEWDTRIDETDCLCEYRSFLSVSDGFHSPPVLRLDFFATYPPSSEGNNPPGASSQDESE